MQAFFGLLDPASASEQSKAHWLTTKVVFESGLNFICFPKGISMPKNDGILFFFSFLSSAAAGERNAVQNAKKTHKF